MSTDKRGTKPPRSGARQEAGMRAANHPTRRR